MPGKRKQRSDVLEVESDRDSSPEVSLMENGRNTRGASNAYKDSSFMKEQQFQADMKDKKIQVKCNQSGKLHKAKITALSTEEGESITASDLVPGSQIMMEYNKKSYPVTVIKVLDPSEGHSDSTQSDGGPLTKKAKTFTDVMKQAKQSLDAEGSDSDNGAATHVNRSTPKSTTSTPCRQKAFTTHPHHSEIMAALAKIQSTLNNLVEQKSNIASATGAAAVKTEDDAKYIVDGVNLLQLPARDAYAYGRSLLDILFSKEELARSVVYKTKKSDRPPLSPARVQKMFDCINKRFKDHDHAKMMTTLGQKCRDSGRGESSKATQKEE